MNQERTSQFFFFNSPLVLLYPHYPHRILGRGLCHRSSFKCREGFRCIAWRDTQKMMSSLECGRVSYDVIFVFNSNTKIVYGPCQATATAITMHAASCHNLLYEHIATQFSISSLVERRELNRRFRPARVYLKDILFVNIRYRQCVIAGFYGFTIIEHWLSAVRLRFVYDFCFFFSTFIYGMMMIMMNRCCLV